MDIFSYCLIGFGSLFIYWQRSRRYNRTNDFGVERLPGYFSYVTAKAGDAVLWALGHLAFLLGVFLLATYYQDSWGWVILIPTYALLFFIM